MANAPLTTYQWPGALEPGGTNEPLTSYSWVGAIEPVDKTESITGRVSGDLRRRRRQMVGH